MMQLLSTLPLQRQNQVAADNADPDYLLLASEPAPHDYVPGQHMALRYRSRYLAKRRVMRTIRRLRHEHPK